MYRLFARATIAWNLAYQDKAFQRRDDDRYYLVGHIIKRPQPSSRAAATAGQSTSSTGAPPAPQIALRAKAQKLARQLASLIQQLDADDVSALAGILGLKVLEQPVDLAFEQACLAIGESADPILIERTIQDLEQSRSLIPVALSALEAMNDENLGRAQTLLERIHDLADAGQLARVQVLTSRLGTDTEGGDAVELAVRLVDRGADEAATSVALVDAMVDPPAPDPDDDPDGAKSHLMTRWSLLNRAAVRNVDSVEAWEARNEMIATIAAGLPADGYPDLPRQELLAIVHAVQGVDALDVVDAIVEVAKLHQASPTGQGSARLVFGLAVAAGTKLNVPAKKLGWARGQAATTGGEPSERSIQFVLDCCHVLGLKPDAVGVTQST
jgi:hypothetical protein